uniref:Uncharacterized protein n=2 Tax=Anguilla anguilla TaxID=7936 RepID=A0A0E9QW40_ANGAN
MCWFSSAFTRSQKREENAMNIPFFHTEASRYRSIAETTGEES